MSPKIIDSDAHILEPPDLWETYLESEYRERGLHIKLDERGYEYVELDGKMCKQDRGGVLANIAGAGQDPKKILSPGEIPYEEARQLNRPAADPHDRIKLLDTEGVDAVLLYPSIGLDWPEDCDDPKLEAAMCRAYNNWVLDFCKPYPDRLIPIGHIPMLDVQESIKELKRAVNLGAKGLYVHNTAQRGTPYGDPYYDPFWAEASDAGIPVSLHVSSNVGVAPGNLYPRTAEFSFWWLTVTNVGDVLFSLVSLLQGRVFDRFPNLKIAVLEIGSGWLPWYMERMDGIYDKVGFTSPMKLLPSEYLKRQVWVAMEADETTVPNTIKYIGEDRCMWSSDYPHIEAESGALQELTETLSPLTEEARRKVLGENAANLYGLPLN